MDLLIIIDQEGCANVTPNQSSSIRNQHMQKQLSCFLNTLPKSWKIDVLDCHDNGLNVFCLKNQFPAVTFIAQIWNFNIKKHYDFAVLIGFHAAQGNTSPFAHTFRSEIKETLLLEKPVGEVTLIVNWLRSFNIPILWINGEEALKSEVAQLKIPFINNYSELTIKPPFSKEGQKYIDSYPIKIRLIHDKLLDAFPAQLFTIKDNYIIFSNINNYLTRLSEVSIFLNAARNYFHMYLKKLSHRIKWNYTKEELASLDDDRLNDLLSRENLLSITTDDISYLEKKLMIK